MKYFISFVFNSQQGTGFSNCIFETVKSLSSYDDILEAEQKIQQSEKLPSLPVIISFIKMHDVWRSLNDKLR